ncbi:hypothetical protein ASZ90_014384 [hydrocarbon metagenome]|uniref:Uncharacterized protein n=1 Tax=hydrocarbon metagenome TaxID=938273 RepID=A0A0W8F532_9ZZZZ
MTVLSKDEDSACAASSCNYFFIGKGLSGSDLAITSWCQGR